MPRLESIMPSFIVEDIRRSTAFYRDELGFELDVVLPEDAPFFAIVCRDAVRISLKEVDPEVHPQPNHGRHEFAPWDAFIYTPEPD